jgi:glycosyltransferase involved in cell wall biosynthesis
VDVLINAANILHEKGIDFVLYIVGASEEQDNDYLKTTKTISKKLEQKGKIKFSGKVPNNKTPEIYNKCQVTVNLTQSGSFDKTILEAMACETLVLVSNRSFKRDLPEECMFEEGTAKELAEKIMFILSMPEKDKMLYGKNFRKYVVENHDLDRLINDLLTELQLSMQNK